MITADQMRSFAPNAQNIDSLVEALNNTLDRFNINTDRRQRYFLAQAYFETQGFTHFVENLMYTHADRLCAVWPHRFSMEHKDGFAYAPDYVNSPDKLANLVYANREGNGDEASGDGYNFRGAGWFHLTFRNNYAKASQDLYGDDRLVQNPSLVQTLPCSAETAGWFWDVNKLNALADTDSFTQVTKIINGSDVTIPDRIKVLNVANTIF